MYAVAVFLHNAMVKTHTNESENAKLQQQQNRLHINLKLHKAATKTKCITKANKIELTTNIFMVTKMRHVRR